MRSHQPTDPGSATVLTPLPQPETDPRTAIRLAALLVSLLDQEQQSGVGLGARSKGTAGPRVITTARDCQRFTKLGDGVFLAHGFYPFKTSPDGSEIIPKVFFKMSRCCATRRSSFWSRRFSACNASSVLATCPAGRALNCFFQFCKVWRLRPSSWAICRPDLPESIQCST